MKTHPILFIVLLSVFVSEAGMAGDESKDMEWLGSDLSPLSITKGPQTGQGYFDRITSLLQSLFTGYKHTPIYANSYRRERQMRLGNHMCTVSMLYSPEREQFMVFSQPYASILPNGAILLKERLPLFKPYLRADGSLMLSRILAGSTLKLGLSQGRFYGDKLDSLLHARDEPNPLPNVSVLNGVDSNIELYKLLQRGALDFVIGYPLEEHYFAQYLRTSVPTIYVPIAEEPALVERYFACKRTPWGQQRVAEMNRLLESKALRQQLQDIYENQLSPESVKLYRKQLAHQQ